MGESPLDLLEPYFLESESYVSGAACADIHTYLPDDLLVKVDIASMAYGLEARSPFLDHHFLEWASQIPVSQKIRAGQTKYILKKALEPYLPMDLLYRQKMGFGVPIQHWLRHDLKGFAYEILLSDKAIQRGIFKKDYVKRLLDENSEGRRSNHTRLWALIMLELWFQMWIDSSEIFHTAPA